VLPPTNPLRQHSRANPTQKNGVLRPTNPPPFFCLSLRTLKSIKPYRTVIQGMSIKFVLFSRIFNLGGVKNEYRKYIDNKNYEK